MVLTLPDKTKYFIVGDALAALERSVDAAALASSSPLEVGGHQGTMAQEVTKIWCVVRIDLLCRDLEGA